MAEKELCKGTLIEVGKLNDVKGVGRQQRKAKKPALPPPETVLELRGGVLARVSVAASSAHHSSSAAAARDPTEPCVADGAELLVGLSEEQRNALLTGEALAGTVASTTSDFHRPLEHESYQEPASARAAPRAAPWARRRTGGSSSSRWRQHQQQEEREQQLAEAETDEELSDEPAKPPELSRPPALPPKQPRPVEAQAAHWDPIPGWAASHAAEVAEDAPSPKQKKQKKSSRADVSSGISTSRLSFAMDEEG